MSERASSAIKPLSGRRIVVTRTRRQAGSLSQALRELGADVIELPTVEIVPPASYGPLDRALAALREYQWLVATSANAAQAIGDRLASAGIDPALFAAVQVAAVGPSTARALVAIGFKVALVPPQYVAESLVEALSGQVEGTRVLLVRAAVARDVVPDGLARLGATVDIVEAYRNTVPKGSATRLRALLASGADKLPDAVTFTSSSTVANFFQLLRDAGLEGIPAGLRALSIGPVTSATLREHGWQPAAEAVPHDVDGLVQTAVKTLRTLRRKD